MSNDKNSIMIVELDAILDTRIPIFMEMGVDLESIAKLGYRNRVYDRFPGVDYDMYMKLYRERDERFLKTAVSTELLHHIREQTSEHNAMADAANMTGDKEVWINTYPYNLDDDQMYNIGSSVKEITTGSGLTVRVYRKPIEELTPDYLEDKNVHHLYLHHYEEWLNHHVPDMERDYQGPVDCHIVTPWLISVEMTEELGRAIDELMEAGNDPAKIAQGEVSRYIGLELTKSRLFSSVMMDDITPPYVYQ